MLSKQAIADVESYIESFPSATQKLLQQLRSIIKKTAADAEEGIGYQMPAYKLNGKPLVYFAGYEKHIGFYPTSSGIAAFKKEISKYKNAKGSVQFPLNKKLPVELIKTMVKFRVQEVETKNKKNTFAPLGVPAQRAIQKLKN